MNNGAHLRASAGKSLSFGNAKQRTKPGCGKLLALSAERRASSSGSEHAPERVFFLAFVQHHTVADDSSVPAVAQAVDQVL